MNAENSDPPIPPPLSDEAAKEKSLSARRAADSYRRKPPATSTRISSRKAAGDTLNNPANEPATDVVADNGQNLRGRRGGGSARYPANGLNDDTIANLIKYQEPQVIRTDKSRESIRTREISTSVTNEATNIELLSQGYLRKLRFQTMMKLLFPLSLAILIGLTLIVLMILRASSQMMFNEIVRSGVMKTTSLVGIGANIINQATIDNNWPVRLNLISQSEFDTRVADPTLAGRSEAEKTLAVARTANLLKDYFTIATNGVTRRLPVKIAYVYDFLPPAAAELPLVGYGDFHGGMNDLVRTSIIPDNSWLPWYVRMTNPVTAYFNEVCEIWPAKIVWHDSRENANEPVLMFRMRINGTNNPEDSHSATASSIGYVMLGLTAKELLLTVSSIRNTTLFSALIVFVLAVLICFYFAYLTTRNTQELLIDMNKVAGGDLSHISTIDSNDAIGELARQFNRMIGKIVVSEENKRKIAAIHVELDVAREIQAKLLPERLPKIKNFDVYADYKPAKEVGGDYYDFFPINRTHVGIIVADVSGKGVPACVVMATTRTILRFVAVGNTSSSDTLKRANAMLASDIRRGMFVTAFYLILNVLTREITCSSAGHNPMVIVRSNGTCEKINPKGIALGFDKGRVFDRMIEEQKIRLNSGDRVVIYTDGVVEAMNLQNEEYTDERFYRFAMKNYRMDSAEFTNCLLEDLKTHQHSRDTRKNIADQHDDITIVTFNAQ